MQRIVLSAIASAFILFGAPSAVPASRSMLSSTYNTDASALGFLLKEEGSPWLDQDLGWAIGLWADEKIGKGLRGRDLALHNAAARQALWELPTHKKARWRNEETGSSGEIQSTSEAYLDIIGSACRRFKDSLTISGEKKAELEGIACYNGHLWVISE